METINIKYLCILIITLCLIFPSNIDAQKKEYVNPKGKLYYGFEIGKNKIASTNRDVFKDNLQIGFSLEYYFEKQWSTKFRVKMYDTGISYYQISNDSWFSPKAYNYSYKGRVISMPLDMIWNFRFFRNLHGNLFIGPAYNIEISSDYQGLETIEKTERSFDKSYFNLHVGWGLNYYYSNNLSFYINNEIYFLGGKKGYHLGGGLLSNPGYVSPINKQINFGLNYSPK